MDKKEEKKRFIVLFIICILFASLSAFAAVFIMQKLNTKEDDGKNGPDNSIIETDSKDGEKEDGVSLEYAGYVTLKNDEGLITLNFTNPSSSSKSLSLEIVDNIDGSEVSLAKTDIIRPGNKVTSAKYTSDKSISKGTYPGKFVVHFYGDEDKEEIVVTNIDIKVYVK